MEGKGSFWRFILLVTCVEPTLTIQSMAEVVYSDQRVQIYCRINSNTEFSQWSFTPVHNTTPIVLVSKEAGLDTNFKERYDFKQENADILTILRAQHQDSGRYTCKKVRNRSNISEFSTEVIVLYGNMSCGPTDAPQLTEGESLMLQCNISYSGNLRAVMQWTGSDNRPIDSQHQTQYTTTEKDAHYPTTATSTLRLTADRSTNRIMYICTVYFNTSAVSDPHDDDTSPKLYWTSPQITCQYKPRDVKISPVEKDDFYAGDSLTCTADALPEAEFIWKLEKNNKSYSGNTFTIEESSGIDEAFLLTCTAKNSLGSTDNSRPITIRSKYLLPASSAATIAVSCVLLVLVAVLAVYVIHLKRNGAGDEDNKTTEQRPEGSQSPHSESHSNTPEPNEDLAQEQEQGANAEEEEEEEEEEDETETDNYARLGARKIPEPSVYIRLKKQIPEKSTPGDDSEPFESSREETSDYVNAESAVLYYNVI